MILRRRAPSNKRLPASALLSLASLHHNTLGALMFSASADLYDPIYSGFKDYATESEVVAAAIRSLHPGARTVLDVAYGTGEHARLLAEVHGFETEGDMTSFELARSYDVILCLFSSIGYVLTLEKVRRTFDRFREHLTDDGIVLVEPWFVPGMLQAGRVAIKTAETTGGSVARMSHIELDGKLSRQRFKYLIGRPDGIEHAVEVHELGLFTTEEMLACFHEAGLHATYDPKGPTGRGLFVARRKTSTSA